MFTKIECGECGGEFQEFTTPDAYDCDQCGRILFASDFLPNMEEGESLTVRDGALGYTTEEV